jgi:hypothetical protein
MERVQGLDYVVAKNPTRWNDEDPILCKVAAHIMVERIQEQFPWVSVSVGDATYQEKHPTLDAFVEENTDDCLSEAEDGFIVVKSSEVDFTTPQQCQGQIVICSYGRTFDYIIEKSEDRSDRTTSYTAYKFASKKQNPEYDVDEFAQDIILHKPKLGRCVGVALLR